MRLTTGSRTFLSPSLMFISSLFATLLLATRQEGLRIFLVAVAYQPLAGTFVEVLQSRTSGYHHPHREFWVSGLSCLPLFFGYKKFPYSIHVPCAQDSIQSLSETRIIGHRLFSLSFLISNEFLIVRDSRRCYL